MSKIGAKEKSNPLKHLKTHKKNFYLSSFFNFIFNRDIHKIEFKLKSTYYAKKISRKQLANYFRNN